MIEPAITKKGQTTLPKPVREALKQFTIPRSNNKEVGWRHGFTLLRRLWSVHRTYN